MDMKPKQPLLNLPNLAALLSVGALLVLGAALVLPQASSALHTALALFSFLCGIVLTSMFVLRPMRKAYRARVALLRHERNQLVALNEELHRQATSDALLGMANRREFERVLELEWRRAARERQPLSLLMIDVDHFKIYNDTHGHLQGDDCLRQVAAALKDAAARPGDLVARYGGEEMAILLPRTDLEGATHMAQRVHALLAERAIPFSDSPIADRITVSIGVTAMLPVRKAPAHAIIQQADEGLYAAKESGRNRTEVVPRLRLIASWEGESQRTDKASGA